MRLDASLPQEITRTSRTYRKQNQFACPACWAFLSRRARLPWHAKKMCAVTIQGHPTDLFLTISVLQRKFCWLGTEVSAVLLGSKVLNLRSRIYQMYQKFLLEIFYPSNLLEIFLGCISSWVSGVIGSSQVAPLSARIVRAESRADDLFTADQKICTWAPLLEIRNQATLRHWITGNGSLAVRTIHKIHVYAKGKVSLNILNILSTIMHACYF